jgi:GNAT superfamily N-acetyltransferase
LDLAAITVRPASLDDAERITAFVLEISENSFMQEFSAEGQANFRAQHSLEKTLERFRSGFRYRLSECDGELVALIGIRDNTHLHHLFVAPKFQRLGLGRRLWEMEKAESLRTGASSFTVNASLNAIAVYERFGFVIAAPVQDMGGVRFVPMRLG